MIRGLFGKFAGICVVLLLFGCQPGRSPFLIAQLCLVNQSNYSMFVNELKQIARSQNMTFTDTTSHTREDLKAIDADNNANIDIQGTIDLQVTGPAGMGLSVGNLGLPHYQVAIGFSEGSDSARGHRFADYVIGRLRTRWRVEIVPTGEGARAIRGC